MPTTPPRLFPTTCPSCSAVLVGTRLTCTTSSTFVEGRFPLPILARLDPEDQGFVVSFIVACGNVKALLAKSGVFYPAVRNRLDALVARIEQLRRTTGAEHD